MSLARSAAKKVEEAVDFEPTVALCPRCVKVRRVIVNDSNGQRKLEVHDHIEFVETLVMTTAIINSGKCKGSGRPVMHAMAYLTLEGNRRRRRSA